MRRPVGVFCVLICGVGPALAHGSEGAIVLLLPTGYYLFGASFTVAVTALLMAIIPADALRRRLASSILLGTPGHSRYALASWISFLVFAALVVAGIVGSRDPLDNPLPTFIWTVFWVCFTILQALTGDLWRRPNPWSGPLRLAGADPRFMLPERIGHGIAILQFSAFAWFELIDLAPMDPYRLAVAVASYWIVNFIGAAIFGERDWMERCEPFSILFRLIGSLSPLRREAGEDGRGEFRLGWPGGALLSLPPMPLSGVLLVLLVLSTVSFDGFSRTFVWLGTIGVNPLEFPGRSAVAMSGSLGLILAFALLAGAFGGCVWLGCRFAGIQNVRIALGRLIYSIVPIALAFQAAHYLTTVLVDGQSFLAAVSDPYALGWNLFGTADRHVTTSFLNTLSGVTAIFNFQTGVIAIGHMLAVVLAHALIGEQGLSTRRAFLSQIPLSLLMIFYTGFGLWLLSTPRI